MDAIAGRSPGAGGRPLRRRRENGVVIGAPRLRGTAALQAEADVEPPDKTGRRGDPPLPVFRMPAGILRYSVRIITIPAGLTVMAEPLGVGVEKPDLKERRIMLDIRTNYRHQN
jgi:hypothetical protein